jgi:hypothetical protein
MRHLTKYDAAKVETLWYAGQYRMQADDVTYFVVDTSREDEIGCPLVIHQGDDYATAMCAIPGPTHCA